MQAFLFFSVWARQKEIMVPSVPNRDRGQESLGEIDSKVHYTWPFSERVGP